MAVDTLAAALGTADVVIVAVAGRPAAAVVLAKWWRQRRTSPE